MDQQVNTNMKQVKISREGSFTLGDPRQEDAARKQVDKPINEESNIQENCVNNSIIDDINSIFLKKNQYFISIKNYNILIISYSFYMSRDFISLYKAIRGLTIHGILIENTIFEDAKKDMELFTIIGPNLSIGYKISTF